MWENIMKRLKDIYQKITGVTSGFNEDHVGAYAAQSTGPPMVEMQNVPKEQKGLATL